MGKSLLPEGTKAIHPKSRKAKQLSRKITRDAKMVKKKAASNMKLQVLGEKLLWFKENLDSDCECYTLEDLKEFIQRYIDRNMDELEQIHHKNSIGYRKSRQYASREDLIRICKENELKQFQESGFETIDLTDRKCLDIFRTWNGALKLISNFKLITLKSSTQKVPSSEKSKPVESAPSVQEAPSSSDEEMVIDEAVGE